MLLLVLPLVGMFSYLTIQGEMANMIDSVNISIFMLVYAEEIEDFQPLVHGFFELRQSIDLPFALETAKKLDTRVNDSDFVKHLCNEKISTFELAKEKEPYKTLQEICPPLKAVSYSKAVEIVGPMY